MAASGKRFWFCFLPHPAPTWCRVGRAYVRRRPPPTARGIPWLRPSLFSRDAVGAPRTTHHVRPGCATCGGSYIIRGRHLSPPYLRAVRPVWLACAEESRAGKNRAIAWARLLRTRRTKRKVSLVWHVCAPRGPVHVVFSHFSYGH